VVGVSTLFLPSECSPMRMPCGLGPGSGYVWWEQMDARGGLRHLVGKLSRRCVGSDAMLVTGVKNRAGELSGTRPVCHRTLA
jgi:hypothetical protein